MQFEYTPYLIPLLAATFISLWIAVLAWSHHDRKNMLFLALLSAAIAEWLIGYALEMTGVGLATKTFWGISQYIGIVGVPLAWFFFAIYQSNFTSKFNLRRIFPIFIIPIITLIAAFTTQSSHLLWTEFNVVQANHFSVLGVSHGPWFWVHSIFSYVLLIGGAVILLRSISIKKGAIRIQAVLLIIAAITPLFGNVMYLSGLNPIPHLDLTPFSFMISIVLIAWAILGFQLVNLVPIARDKVVEGMADGIMVLDALNIISDANAAALALVNLPANQVIGQPVLKILQRWPDLYDRFINREDILEEITIGEGETQEWYELSLSPLQDKQKNTIGRLITIRNITAKKKQDEQLRQLSRAVESSPVSIVITDGNGVIEYINPKAEQTSGYSSVESIGQNPRILKSGLTPPEVYHELWQTIQSGKDWAGEFSNRRKNGEIYWEHAQISPIFDDNGAITHYVAVKEDVTNQREIHEQLVLRQAELTEANVELGKAARLKDEFLANMSHELRTPLNVILNLSESLGEGIYGALKPEQVEPNRLVMESGQHLLSLINDILDLSRIEADKVTLEIAPVELEIVSQASLRLVRQLASQKQLRVEFSYHDVPPVILADERRVKQMLVNLLSNAIKFTPEHGKIGLEVSPSDEGHTVCFTVWDSGIGIPPEKIALLFQPFMQLDSSLSRRYTGTGLGLVLVRRLAELHGGTVGVESQPGNGSRFFIQLPVKLPTPQPVGPTIVETVEPMVINAPVLSFAPDLPEPKRQVSVLLADDDHLNQKIISGYLSAKGFSVTTAGDGHAAIRLAIAIKPDLILMDIQMPDMDGLEAMRQLRLLPEFSTIPIIALTALAMQGDRDACLSAGANEYMTKPVKLQALTRTIELLLGQNQ